MTETKHPLKVFLCHAHADRNPVPQGDDMRGLYTRLTKDTRKRTPTRTLRADTSGQVRSSPR